MTATLVGTGGTAGARSARVAPAARHAAAAPGAAPPAGPYTVDMTNREDVRQFFYRVHEAANGVDSGWTGSIDTCNPGTVSSDFLDATLSRINYFRAMAGVPSNVTFDPNDNAKSQAAALMFSAQGELSHDPPNTWACWTQAGHDGAAGSNIGISQAGPDGIDQFMYDGGANNTDTGHRRNMLYVGTNVEGYGGVPATAGHSAADAVFVLTPSVNPKPTPRDGFWAWPPKGFVPYQTVYPRWSFNLANADFTNATVTMTHNGNNVPVTIQGRNGGFGDPAIIWVPTLPGVADGSSWPKPNGDDPYVVTISGVTVGGNAAGPFTYTSTVIDPAAGDAAHAPTGTASPPVGQNSTYTVPAIPNATGYQWRTTPLTPSTLNDGAENGLGNWTANVNGGGYNPIQTTDVASGTHAFQLAQTTFNAPDTLTLNQTLLPGATSQLTFDSKVVNFDNLDASVQVSTDGGTTWGGPLYDQVGGNEASFSHKTVSLAAYAGQQIQLRFATAYTFNGGNVCECTADAWHFDNVALTNTNNSGTSVLSAVGANPSFSFNPPSAGAYAIDVRPQYSNPTAFGVFTSALQVTASGGGGTTPTVVGLIDGAGNAYVKSGTLSSPFAKVAGNATAISVGADATHGSIVGVIANGGIAYVRVGNGAFVKEASNATGISVATDATNGPVIGVIANSGIAYVKQGSLTAAWVKEASNATAISVGTDATHGPILGLIANSGLAYVKQGSLTAAFVKEASNATGISVASDGTNGAIIGVIANSGIAYAKQGTPSSAFVKEASNATAVSVASDATHGALFTVVANSGLAYAKQGSLTSAFVKEASGASVVAAGSDATSGPLFGVIANGTIGYVKQGTLSSAFAKQSNTAAALSVAG